MSRHHIMARRPYSVQVEQCLMADEHQQPDLAKTACGGRLKDTKGYPGATYRGERVYFCTNACLIAFEQDPDRFIAGEVEHPTDNERES